MLNAAEYGNIVRHITQGAQTAVNPISGARKHALILGAGSIGSMCSIAAAKMGFDCVVVDNDVIEAKNVVNQLYGIADLVSLKHKAAALEIHLNRISPYGNALGIVMSFERFFAGYDWSSPFLQNLQVAILTPDTMQARRAAWNGLVQRWSRLLKPFFLIDVRVGPNAVVLNTMLSSQRGAGPEYAQTLYTDEEAQGPPCREMASIVTPLLAASMVGVELSQYLQWLATRQAATPAPLPHRYAMRTTEGEQSWRW